MFSLRVLLKLGLLDNLSTSLTTNHLLTRNLFVHVAVQCSWRAEPFLAIVASQSLFLFLASPSPFLVQFEKLLACELHRAVFTFERNAT